MKKVYIKLAHDRLCLVISEHAISGQYYLIDGTIQRCPSAITASYWGIRDRIIASELGHGYNIPASLINLYRHSSTKKIKYVNIQFNGDEPLTNKGFIVYQLQDKRVGKQISL